jgi:hypothetical protein
MRFLHESFDPPPPFGLLKGDASEKYPADEQ